MEYKAVCGCLIFKYVVEQLKIVSVSSLYNVNQIVDLRRQKETHIRKRSISCILPKDG